MSDCRATDQDSPPHVWTVSELNHMVRDVLEQSIGPLWLGGEIGNITIHRSGHVYFTLKDARSQVSAVFFRGAETARQLDLRTGMTLEVHGRLSVYEPRGAYQLTVSLIRPQGQGDLQRQLEELKARLRQEGLFDEDRKRPVPVLPTCVGLVTSPDGAAIRDFLQIVQRRFSGLHVRVVPVPVQGPDAAPRIAAAIRLLGEHRACDVIVVTRGGGSLEDLWAFNEEVVVRAVAGSLIPVVSAVGHERDFTLCDFAADLRVPTPSAAAELVVAAKAELVDRLQRFRQALRHGLQLRLSRSRERLQRLRMSRVFHEPAGVVRVHQQRLDELSARLHRALCQEGERSRSRYLRAVAKLEALGPQRVLARGYSILLDETGVAVRRAEDTSAGASLHAVLSSGGLRLTVGGLCPAAGPAEDGTETDDGDERDA